VVAGTGRDGGLAFVLYKKPQAMELIRTTTAGSPGGGIRARAHRSNTRTAMWRQIEQIIGKTPGVQGYFTILGGFAGGVNQSFIGVILKKIGANAAIPPQLVGMLFPQLFGIVGVRASRTAPGAAGFSQPCSRVQNPDFARLGQAMDTLVRGRRHQGPHETWTPDLRVNKPELRVTFDRDRAEDLGVPVARRRCRPPDIPRRSPVARSPVTTSCTT